MMTSEQLTISVQFNDDDMVMLQAEVATAGFRGRTEAYSTYPSLERWVDSLRTFSRALDSKVRFDAGQPDGMSHIGVALSRLDWSGHCACRVSLLWNRATEYSDTPHDTLDVRLVVEPGALDRFVRELELLLAQHEGEATLTGLAQG
jgi:hypothetical protein